jgi:hypothetical protein
VRDGHVQIPKRQLGSCCAAIPGPGVSGDVGLGDTRPVLGRRSALPGRQCLRGASGLGHAGKERALLQHWAAPPPGSRRGPRPRRGAKKKKSGCYQAGFGAGQCVARATVCQGGERARTRRDGTGTFAALPPPPPRHPRASPASAVAKKKKGGLFLKFDIDLGVRGTWKDRWVRSRLCCSAVMPALLTGLCGACTACRGVATVL